MKLSYEIKSSVHMQMEILFELRDERILKLSTIGREPSTLEHQ